MKYYIVKMKRSTTKIDLWYRTDKELAQEIAENCKALYPTAKVKIIENKDEEPFKDEINKK